MRNVVSPLSGIRSPFGGRSDLYKISGFRPEFVADFGGEYYRANLARSTFADTLTFSRASSATMVDSTGTLVTVGVDEPRIGHHIWDGSAWVNEGYLHESEARTNLVLNSATLSTQDVTVTAVPHTLHFTGTGTITLSGASTAGPLVGTGTGENNRVSLTFTPTAGTLTLTVSGTVTNADLEVGSTLSSHKPTTGSTATRAAETLTAPSANLPWGSALSIQMEGTMTYADTGTAGEVIPTYWFQDTNNNIQQVLDTNSGNVGQVRFQQKDASVSDTVVSSSDTYSPGINVSFNIASRHGSTFVNGAVDGTALTENTTPVALPDLSSTDLEIGYDMMGTIKTLRIWANDLGDEGIEKASEGEPSSYVLWDATADTYIQRIFS